MAADYISQFLRKIGMVNTSTAVTFNVSKLVCPYIPDTMKYIDDIFTNNTSSTLNFIGFDELIANPSPTYCGLV